MPPSIRPQSTERRFRCLSGTDFSLVKLSCCMELLFQKNCFPNQKTAHNPKGSGKDNFRITYAPINESTVVAADPRSTKGAFPRESSHV